MEQVTEPGNWLSLARMPATVVHPLDFAARYFFGGGRYPTGCPVRTPTGVVSPIVYSSHDVITVNEVFCRLDYRLPAGAATVVDIGSNIGISALYFLSRSPAVRCHLYEPDPRNVERLQQNLAGYAGRYALSEVAVGDQAGRARFGREPSGRYGGIDVPHAETIEVDCLHINEVLETVLESSPRVDLLKVDTEGLENRTIASISPDLLNRVGVICFETRFPFNPAPKLFELSSSTETARLTARTAPA